MARLRLQAADWATLIDEWKRSGLSLPDFCQLHGLNRGTMQNWVYKPALRTAVEAARRHVQGGGPLVAEVPPPDEPTAAFVPIEVAAPGLRAPSPQVGGVEIILGSGRRFVIGPGFDTETLRRALAVLEERPC